MVEAERIVRGQVSKQRRYYISSLAVSAQELAQAISTQWGIENLAHWLLDMQFDEDRSRVRKGYAAEDMVTLRSLTLNLIQLEPTFRKSVRGRRLAASWSSEYLLRILTSV